MLVNKVVCVFKLMPLKLHLLNKISVETVCGVKSYNC